MDRLRLYTPLPRHLLRRGPSQDRAGGEKNKTTLVILNPPWCLGTRIMRNASVSVALCEEIATELIGMFHVKAK